MNFKIKRVIEEPDLSQVKKLFYDYGVERSFDQALGDYQKEIDELPGKYKAPEGILLLGTIDSQAAGCIGYQQLDSESCEMKRMYVSPPYRGKGLGKLLVQQLLKEALKAGYKTMKLDSHPSMLSAQKLYKDYGFSRTSRYNNNPIEGILFYELDL